MHLLCISLWKRPLKEGDCYCSVAMPGFLTLIAAVVNVSCKFINLFLAICNSKIHASLVCVWLKCSLRVIQSTYHSMMHGLISMRYQFYFYIYDVSLISACIRYHFIPASIMYHFIFASMMHHFIPAYSSITGATHIQFY